MQRDGCVGQHLPTFRTGQAVKMKNINYYGQKITVSDEVAEFLEQDRLRESAQRRSDQRHLDFVGNEIYTMPGLFTDEPTDPTFEQAFLLCGSTNSGRSFQLCLMMTRNCFGFTTFGSIHWNRSARNLV